MNNSEEWIRENWAESADNLIKACRNAKKFNGSCSDFLNHCVTCGGNWGGMWLSGIKELYPDVYDAIPDQMGDFAFVGICHTLNMLGVHD